MMIKIRPFKKSDADQIAQLYHDTIRQINRADYSEQQVKAWAPDDLHFRDWEKTCSQKHTFVAEEKSKVVGFAELEQNGHIGCFYSHKDYQGQGIGAALFEHLLKEAPALGVHQLTADVSITAKPFFEKIGFEVVEEQQVMLRGETFTNYKISKSLNIVD